MEIVLPVFFVLIQVHFTTFAVFCLLYLSFQNYVFLNLMNMIKFEKDLILYCISWRFILLRLRLNMLKCIQKFDNFDSLYIIKYTANNAQV